MKQVELVLVAHIVGIVVAAPTSEPNPTKIRSFVPIVKQIHRYDPDGSMTFGYESGDGSFRYETLDGRGQVYGKYGYIDSQGHLRVVEYMSGTSTGFRTRWENVSSLVGVHLTTTTTVRPQVFHQQLVPNKETNSHSIRAGHPSANRLEKIPSMEPVKTTTKRPQIVQIPRPLGQLASSAHLHWTGPQLAHNGENAEKIHQTKDTMANGIQHGSQVNGTVGNTSVSVRNEKTVKPFHGSSSEVNRMELTTLRNSQDATNTINNSPALISSHEISLIEKASPPAAIAPLSQLTTPSQVDPYFTPSRDPSNRPMAKADSTGLTGGDGTPFFPNRMTSNMSEYDTTDNSSHYAGYTFRNVAKSSGSIGLNDSLQLQSSKTNGTSPAFYEGSNAAPGAVEMALASFGNEVVDASKPNETTGTWVQISSDTSGNSSIHPGNQSGSNGIFRNISATGNVDDPPLLAVELLNVTKETSSMASVGPADAIDIPPVDVWPTGGTAKPAIFDHVHLKTTNSTGQRVPVTWVPNANRNVTASASSPPGRFSTFASSIAKMSALFNVFKIFG